MRKVIISGANGFVGTAVCRELSEQGCEVIAIVRDEREKIDAIKSLPRIRIVYCDLCHFGGLANIIQDRDIDVLYHFAWVGSAGPLRGNVDVQLNNIKYACDTLMACKEMRIPKFVFASSIMEYEIEAIMASEKTPSINTLYSSAKLATDYIARTLAGSLNIEYIRAIISNIYGPGENNPRLINSSLRKLLKGEHCSFSLGEQVYDFIYITDAAKAFYKIGEKGISNHTYYIGSQNPMPLKEFLFLMRDQVDPKIEIGIGEIPFDGVSLSYKEFDIDTVYRDTGFKPEVTFEEGIQRTIMWIKEEILGENDVGF